MQGVGLLPAAVAALVVGSACDRMPTAPRQLAASDPPPALALRGGRVSVAPHPLGIPNGALPADANAAVLGRPSPRVQTSPSFTLGCPNCQPSALARRVASKTDGGDPERGPPGPAPATHSGRVLLGRFSNYAVAW